MLQILDFCILWTLHWRDSVTLWAHGRTRPSWPTPWSSSSRSRGTPPARPERRWSFSPRPESSVQGSRNYSVLIDDEVMLLEGVCGIFCSWRCLFVCQNNCEMNECNNPLTTTSTSNLKTPLTIENINLEQERVTVSPKNATNNFWEHFNFYNDHYMILLKRSFEFNSHKSFQFSFWKALVLSPHYNFELTAEQPSILHKHFQTFQTSSQSTLRRWITITGDSCLVNFCSH